MQLLHLHLSRAIGSPPYKMNVQEIFDVIIGLAGTFLFWSIKENWRILDGLKKADHELSLKIEERFGELNHKLDLKIEEKAGQLNHKMSGKDKFIMAHYATKLDVDKILAHLDKRLDKSDIVIENLNNKIDEMRTRK